MKKTIILTALTILIGCSQVETGEIGIKTTYGAVTGEVLSPGMYWYMPSVSKINILSTRIQTVHNNSNASSKDLQSIATEITLNYHLGLEDPVSHFKRLGSEKELIEKNIVIPAMSEVFKLVVAKFNAEELITKRDIVSNEIVKELSNKLKQYDLYVDSVSITNFQFSNAYATAIENKQVAEQMANKAKNDLSRIQIEAQQKIVQAEAQAKSMQLQKSVITGELVQMKRLEIQEKLIEKWNGNLPTYVGNNNPLSVLDVGK